MDSNEVIKLAKKAGLPCQHPDWIEAAECFAKLVLWSDKLFQNLIEGERVAEREACAKLCDEIEDDHWNLYKGRPPYKGSEPGRADPHEQGVSMGAGECAAAIRKRGNK